jgi:RNA polymerase sigma factor (sigma-70 family)
VALITEQDDRTLVEQHRAGDDDAFRAIVLRHHRSLYANALRRLGDPVLAEDAVQEAFLRAFRNLERFEGEYHLDAWLHRIVTNTCHDLGRRQGRDTRLFVRACSSVDIEAPAADEAFEVRPATDVSQALDALPASYREVLLLRFVDELSYPDVAEKAGISEENARARVSRGRNMLKRMLSSTSALVVWAIPPLRRTQLTDADAAVHGAQQVHNVTGITNVAATVQTTPGFGRLTDIVAQAGPTIAGAAPTVSSSGPAVKAAVGAALAAAVAIPTGVAVDRAREKPPRQPVAPLLVEDQEVAAPGDPVVTEKKAASSETPVITVPAKMAPLSSAAATPTDVVAADAGESTTDSSSTTTEPAPTSSTSTPSTSTPPATDTSTPPPAGSTPPPPAEQPPPPEPAPAPPAGTLSAGTLQVAEAGAGRVDISGPITLTVGDRTFQGEISGKPSIGGPEPKSDRRTFSGELRLTIDGTTYDLLVSGSAIVTEQGNTRTLDLDLKFGLPGGGELGLAEGGQLTGTLTLGKTTGSLELTLPGAERTS